MTSVTRAAVVSSVLGAAILCGGSDAGSAQNTPPADRPAVTVKGKTYTPQSILARNMGTPEDQETQFPPHKIVGNIYYVGTKTLSSFLITTSEGHILIDTTYERNVKTIAKSVSDLGFSFSDVKIVLGNHAHRDHQEGDALVKKMTGARIMAMAEDVPALEAMMPAGQKYPIDRVLHHGDTVALGGTTLTAHLTPGHTRGCTTWTTTVRENGKAYNVVFSCSLRSPNTLTPPVVQELTRSFTLARALPCDVQVGDHPAQYNMHEKHARLALGGLNPFIDPAGCTLEADIQEAMFKALQKEQ
jgi:metallo-beta-lactamase class B